VLLGALLTAGTLAAQVVPPDSVKPPPPPAVPLPKAIGAAPQDTTPDSAKVKKDSVETRLAQAEMPLLLEIGESYTWDRAALFNTGGLTIIDVLDRVPGLTVYRSGWIASPQYASYLGNPARVRIFWDGAEMLAIGNSTSSPLDLASVPIWSIQELRLERGADEVRIYIQTWNVTRTTTQSRVDIVTGDLGTNLLRAYFGTRFQSGVALQAGGTVWGTVNNPISGGGTASDLMLRLGWAHGPWSVDAYADRQNGTRDAQIATHDQGLSPGIPGENGSRTMAYLRLGLNQPDSGRWWAQLAVNSQQVNQQLGSIQALYFPSDSLRVIQSGTQLIAAGGLNAGPVSVSGSARQRWLPLGTSQEFTGRVAFASRFVSLSAFGDFIADSGGITDVGVKVTPTSWLAFTGDIGYRTADSANGGDGVSGRVAAGVRLGRAWIQVGALQRDATVVPGLVGYDTLYVSAVSPRATGEFFSIRGKLVDDVGVNVWVIRMNSGGNYLPQLQSRAEVFLDTDWLSKFPSGHFGLKASIGDAYRSDVFFPTEGLTAPGVVAFHSNVMFANIEVRILDATLYFTANWALTPRPYLLVPQYLQKDQIFTYGLRWSFWN
jgi:hypothetical protein